MSVDLDTYRPRSRRAEAAHAIGTGSKPRPRRLRVWKWQPVRRGSLAGYVSIEFSIGLRLTGLPVFSAGTSGPWVGLPSRPCLDSERRQKVDPHGKPEYEIVGEWRDRRTADAFSRAVLNELLRRHPHALDGAET